jgi:hypothetical protein
LQRWGHVVTDAFSSVFLRDRAAVGECGALDVNRLGTGVLRAGQRTAVFARPEPAEQLS